MFRCYYCDLQEGRLPAGAGLDDALEESSKGNGLVYLSMENKKDNQRRRGTDLLFVTRHLFYMTSSYTLLYNYSIGRVMCP